MDSAGCHVQTLHCIRSRQCKSSTQCPRRVVRTTRGFNSLYRPRNAHGIEPHHRGVFKFPPRHVLLHGFTKTHDDDNVGACRCAQQLRSKGRREVLSAPVKHEKWTAKHHRVPPPFDPQRKHCPIKVWMHKPKVMSSKVKRLLSVKRVMESAKRAVDSWHILQMPCKSRCPTAHFTDNAHVRQAPQRCSEESIHHLEWFCDLKVSPQWAPRPNWRAVRDDDDRVTVKRDENYGADSDCDGCNKKRPPKNVLHRQVQWTLSQ